MLKRYSQLLVSLLMAADALVTAVAWIAAFYLRFYTVFQDLGIVNPHVPELIYYIYVMFAILPIALLANHQARLYEPRRIISFVGEFIGILRATGVTILFFMAFAFFLRPDSHHFSRTFIILFAVLNILLLVAERAAIRAYLRQARQRGQNQRRALVLGAGKNGQAIANAIDRNPWTGIVVKGFLDDRYPADSTTIANVEVWGGYDRVLEVIRDRNIDQVYLALPAEHQPLAQTLLERLSEVTVDVFMVPDVLSFNSLKLDVSNFEGLPVINLRDSPVYGWNMLLKRGFDIGFSLSALTLLSIPMGMIAAAVKFSSQGPILYSQERMGLDGKLFHMHKFRTMRQDAEAQTGAVWAVQDDPRRTRLGSFLRATSLDELPQFVNVLWGHMSVVGPRPERPVFIDEFKRTVPRYMLRHIMKAGVTGWAQVNGWPGNTSLKKRIQFDLYYIENWSLGFDVYIILLTILRGLINKNAY